MARVSGWVPITGNDCFVEGNPVAPEVQGTDPETAHHKIKEKVFVSLRVVPEAVNKVNSGLGLHAVLGGFICDRVETGTVVGHEEIL
jgi:hypothetical protein